MRENIKRHKVTLIFSCSLVLIALMDTKAYLLNGSIIYRNWANPEGTGLVISGWQALGVLVGEAAIGAYGLILVIKTHVDKGKCHEEEQ
ncbi:hypothetical protein [Geobacter sp. DSM 9736]|uniref:hypothetical protein n=1 Tax=Geobacter sp. DSM 9736 TaxID=1277350 RepID=UPI0018D33BA7|nr:hypothetical protein [Geobacter sp. DSM 9736]